MVPDVSDLETPYDSRVSVHIMRQGVLWDSSFKHYNRV